MQKLRVSFFLGFSKVVCLSYLAHFNVFIVHILTILSNDIGKTTYVELGIFKVDQLSILVQKCAARGLAR